DQALTNSCFCLLQVIKTRARQHWRDARHTHWQTHLPCCQTFRDNQRQADCLAFVAKADVSACVHAKLRGICRVELDVRLRHTGLEDRGTLRQFVATEQMV